MGFLEHHRGDQLKVQEAIILLTLNATVAVVSGRLFRLSYFDYSVIQYIDIHLANVILARLYSQHSLSNLN